MKLLFIDSSVLFAACKSRTGASALIMGLCYKGRVEAMISPHVVIEIKRNVSEKLNQKGKQRLNMYLLQAKLKLIIPTQEEIDESKKNINEKDAPILAAALKSKAHYFLTLDKDFITPKITQLVKPMIIATPKSFLKREYKV